MSDEQTDSEKPATPPNPKQVPLTEGHQPQFFIKGNQPKEFGQQPSEDHIIAGYTPTPMDLSPVSPPQGGSGVPPAKTSSTDTQAPEKKE